MKKLISFTVFVTLLTLGGVVWAAQVDYLCYNDFIKAVEAGQIKSVTFDRYSHISGTYVVEGKEKAFHSYTDIGAANDPLLLRFLHEKSVAVTVSDKREEKRSWYDFGLITFHMFVVPLVPFVTLLFVVLIYLRIRRVQPQKSS
jgi:ATP-dependent Zn protease